MSAKKVKFNYKYLLDILELNIPTALPLVYELDANLKPIKHYYLATDQEVKEKINAVANQGKAK